LTRLSQNKYARLLLATFWLLAFVSWAPSATLAHFTSDHLSLSHGAATESPAEHRHCDLDDCPKVVKSVSHCHYVCASFFGTVPFALPTVASGTVYEFPGPDPVRLPDIALPERPPQHFV
jgi:hypothetical protein